jgi:putative endonuclease
MFRGRLTHAIFHALNLASSRIGSEKDVALHQRTGRRGEEDAYFYLRRRGYTIVARNFRTARHHGKIDLIGWDKDMLCFIEVKTRTTRDVKPAEAAVDREKRRAIRRVARDYLRSLSERQFPQSP